MIKWYIIIGIVYCILGLITIIIFTHLRRKKKFKMLQEDLEKYNITLSDYSMEYNKKYFSKKGAVIDYSKMILFTILQSIIWPISLIFGIIHCIVGFFNK